MLKEVLHFLDPGPGQVVVDLTLGGGGYSAAFLESGARVIGLDLDPEAVAGASRRLSSHGDLFTARSSAFSDFPTVLDELGINLVDGICMDLGLSSDQLDDGGRGFSFDADGAFDLRFDTRRGRPAVQWLRQASVEEIQQWLSRWGEVRRAGRIARALHDLARRSGTVDTPAVRETVTAALGHEDHPNKELARVFQAFRILVNDEMGELERALDAVPSRLAAGGRFVAVSYHSLEDRRVKSMLRRESRPPQGSRHVPVAVERPPRMKILTPRPLRPSPEEIDRNRRARSARLRAAERLP